MGVILFTPSMVFGQQIPLDPQVRTGRLPNGLTYYLRKNNEPQKQAYMMIVNKAGSILEDDDQLGLAHFMEHMNFNGTRHFPKNELVNFLEKSGVTFGADLNAYTSFDETVYILPIPTTNPEMLPKGLDVLRDWASEATLDPVEIDKERGVILEEERLHRGRGERIDKQTFPMLTNRSKYGARSPIGEVDILRTFKPESIKRFKDDWYRPDLQAVIVVGDIDLDKTEKLVKTRFTDLNNPVKERTRSRYEIELKGNNQFIVATDDEQPNVSIEIYFKRKSGDLYTEEEYVRAIKGQLMNQMISFRQLEMTNSDPAPAYLNMGIGKQGFVGGVETMGISVTGKKGKLKEAFKKTWGLVERLRKYGFTEQDLENARTQFLRFYEQRFEEREHNESKSYAQEYVSLFLRGEASPGIAWEYDFVKKTLPKISVSDINALLQGYLEPHDRDIVVGAPTSEKGMLPTEKDIEGWMTEVAQAETSAFREQESEKELLETLPVAGKVVSRTQKREFGVTELKLSNGINVILKPTAYKSDQIIFTAFSEGGTSLYDLKDFFNAAYATSFFDEMGLGKLTSIEMQRKLAGSTAQVSVNIGEKIEAAGGGASVKDIETAFQVLYLKFTSPRKDTVLFGNMLANFEEILANRYLDPQNVFSDSIEAIVSNRDARHRAPSVEDIKALNLDRMYRIYKERFADASGFTFVFVGNFEERELLPLIEKYLGSLPATHKAEKARAFKLKSLEGKVMKVVSAGTENKASVRMFVHGKAKNTEVERMKLRALCEILQMRLVQILREDEGGVYTPSVRGAFIEEEQKFSIGIGFGCSPQNADRLISLVTAALKDIRERGVTAEEVQKFKVACEKRHDQSLTTNEFWLQYLAGQYRKKEDLSAINAFHKDLSRVTAESLLKASQVFFSDKNVLTFKLVPKSTS
ncbi:M16 family metallopeptidase [Chryseolinea soli]|nr:insulinase family protein [Chryseolinea soli]